MQEGHSLSVELVKKSYRQRDVIRGISLKVLSGEVVGLLGPNGAGKTTLFYSIVGLIKPDEGEVQLDSLPITHMPMHERAHHGIAYLPQESSIFRKLTVEDNISSILELRHNIDDKKRRDLLEHLLEDLNLHPIRKSLGIALSGGERRRVEIARTLALEPKFILLDEPFAGVDPISIQDLKAIINMLKKRGIGILITDHNFRDTLAICNRCCIINQGQLIASGPPQEVIRNEEVKAFYLGNQATGVEHSSI